ncbi:MAG: hypothetical protein ACJ8EL_12435 [Rhizomicrobium sp.]|jgi:hypothetical protein
MDQSQWAAFIEACKRNAKELRTERARLERRQKREWQDGPWALQSEIDTLTADIDALEAALTEYRDRAT